MAKLVKIHNSQRAGEESFEFTLSAQEQELIQKEVDMGPKHVLEWVRRTVAGDGLYRLQGEQMTELYESIESVAYRRDKNRKTRKALQHLVAQLEKMVEDFYGDEANARQVAAFLNANPSHPCPCGSGERYQECCGRA